jgi:hypothetical protein
MWVRSQSKYTLINTNIIRICEDDRDDCGDYLICAYSDGYDHELGVYSSFEKATKVLDEIQRSIMTENQFRIDELNCTRNFFAKEYKEIYQMPQDEDVEA